MSGWKLTPTMKRELTRIRRRGECGMPMDQARLSQARALLRRGLLQTYWTIAGAVYYAEPKPKDGP